MYTIAMVILFVIGYALIAFEQQIKINKTAIALMMGMLMWVLYIVDAYELIPFFSNDDFQYYLSKNPLFAKEAVPLRYSDFVANSQVVEYMGETAEILFFLFAALTIVEIIDVHGGFNVITDAIRLKSKKMLLWQVMMMTFFLSAVLDNMTTTIVMITMLRKLIFDPKERWLFLGIVIIAANAGGAWSPVGDITTILLWVNGNLTTSALLENVLLPSLICAIVPTFFLSMKLKGSITTQDLKQELKEVESILTQKERTFILLLGMGCILFAPVFKQLTHLPPVMGILLSLSIIWIYTDMMYAKRKQDPQYENFRVSAILHRIDTSTILYFLGILMSVEALRAAGILSQAASFLNEEVHNIYLVNLAIGLMSSVVDNSSLVAASIGMFPLTDPDVIKNLPDATYLDAFKINGDFWQILSYCAGTGGSTLIIGSAAGVVAMGLDNISFSWYLRNISLYALIGFASGGFIFYVLEHWI